MGSDRHGYQVLDVTNEEQVPLVFDEFVAKRGRIDGLVYCAGILKNMTFSAIKSEEINKILNVNFLGAMRCTQAAINIRRARKEACSIVWISSVAYKKPGGAGGFMYAASKGAMVGGVKVLAIELARRNIRINAICPAAVDSDIWNLNTMTDEEKTNIFNRHLLGLGRPVDVANACVFMLSPASRWMTGSEIFMDGGYLLG
jgi:NAD(P)-dependent dehydrogenase (short-subunit alcohol dehydrogenase family)